MEITLTSEGDSNKRHTDKLQSTSNSGRAGAMLARVSFNGKRLMSLKLNDQERTVPQTLDPSTTFRWTLLPVRSEVEKITPRETLHFETLKHVTFRKQPINSIHNGSQ